MTMSPSRSQLAAAGFTAWPAFALSISVFHRETHAGPRSPAWPRSVAVAGDLWLRTGDTACASSSTQAPPHRNLAANVTSRCCAGIAIELKWV
ncbi:hypothetical protein ACWEOE_39395 [Amycolatopsis sp. NPDC004368]